MNENYFSFISACHEIYDYVIELNAKNAIMRRRVNDKSALSIDINSTLFHTFLAAPQARLYPFDTLDEKWL